MPRRLLKRIMPSPERLRATRGLGFIGAKLSDPGIWHLSRRSVRTAVLVGVFACWIPLPVQIPLACGLAVLLRCNLALAASLCWLSNPVTLPAMVYVGYKTGAWMLGDSALTLPDEITLSVLTDNLSAVGLPFLVGTLCAGIVSGLAAAMAMDVLWRFAVLRRWRSRVRGTGLDAWRHGFRERVLAREGALAAEQDAPAPYLDAAIPDPTPDAAPGSDPAPLRVVRDRSQRRG